MTGRTLGSAPGGPGQIITEQDRMSSNIEPEDAFDCTDLSERGPQGSEKRWSWILLKTNTGRLLSFHRYSRGR